VDEQRPAAWLSTHERFLPRRGTALDVACGRGRHAFWLGARGLETTALDSNEISVAAVNAEAASRGLPVYASVEDLEAPGLVLPEDAFDVIVVVHYLHRPLFPALRRALRPGGVLIYETFTRAQALRGRPTNPEFLLEPGELRQLVSPLTVLVEREGEVDGKMLASVIAKRPRAPSTSPPR
jgi:SAM-dependent methyltransferase